jgi:hypothetical protein
MPISVAPSTPSDGVVPASALLRLGEPFTTAEARSIGLSRNVLRRMVGEGTLRLLLRGVYVDAGQADTVALRSKAAAKVVPDGSVICDRTALWIHGADVVGPDGRFQIPPVDVFRIAGRARVRRPQCRGGTRTLVPADILDLDGVMLTSPLRTALDLGRLARRDEALAALDALLRIGGFTRSDLRTQLPRFRGARGVVQLRQLVSIADGRSESPGESLTRLRLVDAGLPCPEVQYEVLNDVGVPLYRLDLAYVEIMLAMEYDGEEHHTSDQDRERDARRREHLRRLGWTVIVLTAKDVYGRDPRAATIVRRARTRLLKSR